MPRTVIGISGARDVDASPYINHPIGLAHLLATTGGISDIVVLQAAVLHDTIEDTETTFEELVEKFGQEDCDRSARDRLFASRGDDVNPWADSERWLQ